MARRRGGGYRAPARRVGVRLPSLPRVAIQPVSRLGSPRTNTVNAVTNMLAVRAEGLQAQQLARQQFEQRLVEAGIKSAIDASRTKPVYTIRDNQLTSLGNVPYDSQVINQTSQTPKPLDPVAEGLRVAQMQQRLADIRAATEKTNADIAYQNAQAQADWRKQQPGFWGRLTGQQGTTQPSSRALATMPDTTTLDQTMRYGQQRLGGLMGQGGAPAAPQVGGGLPPPQGAPSTGSQAIGDQDFQASLDAAKQALQQGASPDAVRSKLAQAHPQYQDFINNLWR